jgi:hypothetical protein
VSTKFRFVAIHPDRAAQWRLGSATALHDLLTHNQTDASGRVFYGHEISYAWILSRWPGNPDARPVIRTLKRHMAKLKRAGLVRVRVVGMGHGMIVTLLGSAKWAGEAAAPATQLPLYAPRAVSISRGKAVDKKRKTAAAVGTDVSLSRGQMCPRKEVRSKPEEKISGASRSHAMPSVENTEEQISERRRVLLDQLAMLQEKYKTSG